MPESVEEIQKAFDKRIKALEPEDEDGKRALNLEMREAIADFREQAAAAREIEAYKLKVITEKGLSEWADFITGVTLEEIDATASKIAERVSKLTEVREAQEARAAYGQPGTGAAGGATPGAKPDEVIEELQDFERKFNNHSITRAGAVRTRPDPNPDAPSAAEGQQYVARVLGARALGAMAKHGSTAQLREAASKVDLATLKMKQ